MARIENNTAVRVGYSAAVRVCTTVPQPIPNCRRAQRAGAGTSSDEAPRGAATCPEVRVVNGTGERATCLQPRDGLPLAWRGAVSSDRAR